VSAASFHFVASGVELEGKTQWGVDIQLPGEAHSGRAHDQLISIGALYADKFPVTNAKYAAYINASGYAPADSANWLRMNFNEAKTKPEPGWENTPVTYVSYDDATAYCAFHKKRLPKVWEWQYIAQGKAGKLLYPWGMEDDPLTCGEPGVANKAR
jgi:iron(II)-dependent oxidoreductase